MTKLFDSAETESVKVGMGVIVVLADEPKNDPMDIAYFKPEQGVSNSKRNPGG